MGKNTLSNIQLGLFVVVGTVFMIVALYMIGNNRNLFRRTFSISATFYDVNGLMAGNNIRFSGIDIGTVKRVEIISDTSVKVTMIIEENVRKYIKKNAIVSVGTDGLMGNKLVNISSSPEAAPIVENGDILTTLKPMDTDKMLRILNVTNLNLADITANVKRITHKLDNSQNLWSILSDTTVAQNLKYSVAGARHTAENAEKFTRNLNSLLNDLDRKNGILNFLLTDTTSSQELKKSLAELHLASEQAQKATADLNDLTAKIKKGEGAAGLLLTDTAFANNLNQSMRNIRTSTAKFDENMEAMKHNFLLKGYFKDEEKKAKKAKK